MSVFRPIYAWLLKQQCRAPWRILLISALITVASVPIAQRLELDSHWRALLPDDKPSVRDLNRIGDQVGGVSTLNVVVQSKNVEAMKRFTRDLVPRLEEKLAGRILRIDWNLGGYANFVRKHKHLYMPLEELEELRDDLQDRTNYEKLKANPLYINLEGSEPPTLDQLITKTKKKSDSRNAELNRFPDGFYIHPDQNMLVFFIRTNIEGGEPGPSEALMALTMQQVRKLEPSTYAKDLKIELAGDVVEALEEHNAITAELIIATTATVVLVLLAIYIFFLRIRAIPLLGLALLPPVALTFAVAEWSVDYLNTSTAFLGSIVIGNGVNPYIIWLARYFEERRHGLGVHASIAKTHRGVWGATLTASLAAALAYGSLTITDFRGFRDFGIIGSVGMLLCWLGSLFVLPALVRISEKARPLVSHTRKQRRAPYGLFFANLIYGFPKTIVALSIVAGIASVVIVSKAIAADPLEYDINKLRSTHEGTTRSQELNDKVNEFLNRTASGTVVIIMLASDYAEAQYLEDQLEKRREQGKADYGAVRTINDLLPTHQDEKIEILDEIRGLLDDAKVYASEEQRQDIAQYEPPDDLSKLNIQQLPEAIKRPFRTRSGALGRLIFIEQSESGSNWDGRYLVRWSEDARAVRSKDGSRAPLAGRPPIFADMLQSIWEDGPIAIAASLLATSIILLIAFNRWLRRLLTLGSLLLGILWMGATMALAGIKLNFLNFVAFPITFGNGVDYGVNVMRRYAAEAVRGTERLTAIRYAVEETGGAVVLCSLTTVIGYMSLYASSNQAINSFGAAMAISEVTCLLASVLSMPAAMVLWRRWQNRKLGTTTPGGSASTKPMGREVTVPGIITPKAPRKQKNQN